MKNKYLTNFRFWFRRDYKDCQKFFYRAENDEVYKIVTRSYFNSNINIFKEPENSTQYGDLISVEYMSRKQVNESLRDRKI
jgi:hypothetical protein